MIKSFSNSIHLRSVGLDLWLNQALKVSRTNAYIASRILVRPVSSAFRKMGDTDMQKTIERAARIIRDAKAILITAGAGMGVDSGLPDFRGAEGFWKAYPPIKKLGLTFPEVSTPRWFQEDPKFAWGFFGHRLKLYRSTKPHRGFEILKRWAESKVNGYFIYTSNVDGHFQKAGFPEEKVVECHGSLNFLQRVDGHGEIWPIPDDMTIDLDEKTFLARPPLPRGPPGMKAKDQQLARPNVLMFNDWYFIESRVDEQQDRFHKFRAKLNSTDDPFVVIEIGAGLAVPTIRYLGEQLVRTARNGFMIRINPRDTDIPSKDHISLPTGGLEALEKIDSLIQEKSQGKKG